MDEVIDTLNETELIAAEALFELCPSPSIENWWDECEEKAGYISGIMGKYIPKYNSINPDKKTWLESAVSIDITIFAALLLALHECTQKPINN